MTDSEKKDTNSGYASSNVGAACRVLLEYSPDLMLDLGVFMHVLCSRQFYGPYRGWADVPVAALAKRSHVGNKRLKESLDRLVRWGFIVASKRNNERARAWHTPLRYRVCLHFDEGRIEKELGVQNTETPVWVNELSDSSESQALAVQGTTKAASIPEEVVQKVTETLNLTDVNLTETREEKQVSVLVPRKPVNLPQSLQDWYAQTGGKRV